MDFIILSDRQNTRSAALAVVKYFFMMFAYNEKKKTQYFCLQGTTIRIPSSVVDDFLEIY